MTSEGSGLCACVLVVLRVGFGYCQVFGQSPAAVLLFVSAVRVRSQQPHSDFIQGILKPFGQGRLQHGTHGWCLQAVRIREGKGSSPSSQSEAGNNRCPLWTDRGLVVLLMH